MPGTPVPCLECGAEPKPIERRRTGVELNVTDSDAPRLEAALTRMTGAPPELLFAIVERSKLELVGDLSPQELDHLYAAFAQLGVSFRKTSVVPILDQYTLRFEVDRRLVLRLAVVLGIATASVLIGLPALAGLGLPVLAVLCWGAIERIPNALELSRSFVEQKLGAIDRTVWNELTVLRRGINGPAAAEAAQRCLTPLCAIIEQIRTGGLHLTRTDFANLDGDAHALLRRSIRLAAAADRIMQAGAQTSPSAPSAARLASAGREMFAALTDIERKLEALRVSLLELRGFEARNEGWLAATTRLTEIQVAVETGLELSILANDDGNRPPRMLGEA